jgi:transcriptional regulator GlxA family with amidase domain
MRTANSGSDMSQPHRPPPTTLRIWPKTWKNKLRIQQAVKLIDQSQLKYVTIEGIGEMVGFQSRTNFIEVFKEQVGKTPSKYLKG